MKKSGVDASEVELVPLKHEGGSKGGKDKHGHHVNGKGDHDDKKAGRGCMSDYTFANVFGIEWARLRKKIFIIMDQPSMQIFLVSMLLFSLYVTDAWVLGNQPDSNTHVLDGMLTTVFVIFVFEVVTLTLVGKFLFSSFCSLISNTAHHSVAQRAMA